MDLTGKALWQVGAGDTERSYDKICKEYDVMLAGPGSLGPFDEHTYAEQGDIKNSLRRFYKEAKQGDVVLLRLGTGKVLAVGEVADDAAIMSEAFDDVDGWDLQHVRRVRWFEGTDKDFGSKALGGQVRTFAAVNVPAVRSWVTSLTVPDCQRHRDLRKLPCAGKALDIPELARRLFIEGLPSESVDKLAATLASLQRVAGWYQNEEKRPEGRPSEQETVTYLVIPLLMSLGWSQQTAAIQWSYVDVALFDRMPPTDDTLVCVVEAKLLGRSVFRPEGQARKYALQPARQKCNRLVVTDGIRYALYSGQRDGFPLAAYLNVLKPRDKYPVYPCSGAVDALLGMAR